jgi:uncharacterized protein (DUF2236 family)
VVAPFDNPVDAVRLRVAGTVREMVTGDRRPPQVPVERSEPGLFAADSATWKVHSDLSMLIGGLRALLLQTLHPLAMAGVADHSDYRDDPWGRLRRTGHFVGVTTFGDEVEARSAIDRVRRIHEHVIGTAPDGRPYSATDPHLLAWVHVTEVDSFLAAHLRYGRHPLTFGEADRYVAEMAVLGELLGAESLPRTVVGMRAWIDSIRPELAVGRQAREAVGFLLSPPVGLLARPAYAVVSAAAIGLLPGWARRKLWLPLAPLTDPVLVRPAARSLLVALGWALDADRPSPS